jgi:beta-ribofuranosylaminobenzene 5'-phosphate synthase
MRVTVKAPCRLHLTLIDLNGGLGRIDGGVGLTLQEPSTVVEIEPLDKTVINAGDRNSELESLCGKISRKYKIKDDFRLTVGRAIPRHAGLGSTTQLYLAAAKALAEYNGIKATANELALLAGRGGTSGIGVGAFEQGGFLVDCGHSYGRGRDKVKFLPSAYSKARPAPVAVRLDFPDWRVLLCVPEGKGLHGVDELKYFRSHFPASQKEAEKISRILLMKMIPAVIEKNLVEFDEAVRLMNEARGFTFPKETQELIGRIRKAGGKATSMSSFGPSVFAFTDDPKTALKLKKAMKEWGTVVETKAQNCGAFTKINQKS